MLSNAIEAQLFQANAPLLKITSASKPPFEVNSGNCELSKCKQHNSYQWLISAPNNTKSRKFNFTVDLSTVIKEKIRGSQFHIQVRVKDVMTQLIGTMHNKEDAAKIGCLFREIDNSKRNASGGWLNAKENLPNQGPKYVTPQRNPSPLSAKKQSRTPLSDKSFSKETINMPLVNRGKKLFPSPSEMLKTTPSAKDNDVKVSAIGGRKPSNFYNRDKKIDRGLSSYAASKPKSFSSMTSPVTSKHSLTFQNRIMSNEFKKCERTSNEVIGFSNLGNTCYMNAILQCLLNIPNFFQDLNNADNLDVVQHFSLYNALCNLGILKYSYETLENQRYALKRVKSAISTSATRFSGYSQHDAHEFLCHCLDQLKEDLSTEMRKKYEMQGFDWSSSESEEQTFFACPIKNNFESTVLHSIICQECNEQVLKTEACHDFSLVIPDFDENSEPKDRSIDDLLKTHFLDEVIEYTCEKCSTTSSVLKHQFQMLPRVLILHIKRYDMYDMKRSDRILLPKTIDVKFLVTTDTVLPRTFLYDKEKMKTSFLTSANLNASEKRKSQEPLQSEPLNKSSRKSDSRTLEKEFLSSEKSISNAEGEFLAQAFRDSKRDEELRLKESKFTSLKRTDMPLVNKKLEFPTMSCSTPMVEKSVNLVDLDANKEFENDLIKLTSVSDDEEDELKKALELSMKEYAERQEQELMDFSFNNNKNDNINVNNSFNNTSIDKETEFKDEESNASDNNNSANKNSYKLVGIVNHHGQNTATGHYTSDSFDFKSEKWRSYNDSSVKEIKEHEARFGRLESAYIVFYMHVDSFNAIMSKQ